MASSSRGSGVKRQNTGSAPKVRKLAEEGHEETCGFDILYEFINNQGLKHIADQILSLLDRWTLANCRLVSRAYRDYLDNERSMLLLQINHFKSYYRFNIATLREQYCGYRRQIYIDSHININNIEPEEEFDIDFIEPEEERLHLPAPLPTWEGIGVFSYFGNIKDESTLRTCLGLLREITTNCSDELREYPFIYMVKNHRHKDLKILMQSPLPILPPEDYCKQDRTACSEWPSRAFVAACKLGCGECVQIFLDHSSDKNIKINKTYIEGNTDTDMLWYDILLDQPGYKEWEIGCIEAAQINDKYKDQREDHRHTKRVLPVLLRFLANRFRNNAKDSFEDIEKSKVQNWVINEYHNYASANFDDDLLDLLDINKKNLLPAYRDRSYW